MQVDLDALPAQDRYKLLAAVVIPRPVAWVTTVSPEGVVNAAPYSFFNVFGETPALIVLGLQHKPDGTPKDTTRNIERTGEFVVNLATPALTEAMVATAAAYPPERGEPEALGLETAPSAKVAPPRLAAAPVSLECRRIVSLAFGPNRALLVGEAVALHAREGLVDPETLRVDWGGDYPVARLFADRYGRVEEIEPRVIPAPRP
ncbi:flavin reductase family protein [Rubrimonas cliftonensis]|uniref:NADH-FMN oxidoreductase RutF, flavin reductase (DIM6/NTAB) family n=1 Tax=Rubrimonas cliftonensis TaxID=89524 RepID=A0A1H3X864_9RHOB|nr:flavin reductase family protein [Rubrimonas cliftonensis]SDZ95131.1 NADH-FMN oxidoreductase RutF, flavin reductase (DIM6/NTAB) family [Rubrimonas cliftonensis]